LYTVADTATVCEPRAVVPSALLLIAFEVKA
jgi:hypothetical protein